ncbi:MAG: Kdo domain containing protein, partial [Flavobacteriaceae bacterium]|nr:Kdo domain containing protein [Flavobacteriaceae bacterium]
MKSEIHPSYRSSTKAIKEIIDNFDQNDTYVARPARNAIKAFDLKNEKITVKRFKIPNIVNKVVYRFLRKSKAERSYRYANKLLELGIGTPKPIAYFETTTPISFLESYYVCEFVDADFTYRELINDPTIEDRDAIL